jgi:mycoredoxin-dependent peroxiredoxin
MQSNLENLTRAGIRVAAISVDPAETSRDWASRSGYTFTILSDPKLDAIHKYDVAVDEEGIARPAEFLVDANGVVRWRNLTGDYYVRARPAQVLEAAKGLE